MQEKYEIRLFAECLPLIRQKIERQRGRVIAAKVNGIVGDPQFVRIGRLDQSLRQTKKVAAFAGWEIKRTYSRSELARAELFWVDVCFKHLSAEEHVTRYEEYESCSHEIDSLEYGGGTEFRIVRRKIPCSLRAKQMGALRLPSASWAARAIFSGCGVASWLSRSASRLWLRRTNSLELTFSPLLMPQSMFAHLRARKNFSSFVFNQLLESKYGYSVWSDTLRHSALGLSVVRGRNHCWRSTDLHVSVIASSWDGSDLCCADVYVDGRQGFFRPYQLLIVSKRLLEALKQKAIKGFRFEIVGTATE